MRILAIDQGSVNCGYALYDTVEKKFTMYGTLKLKGKDRYIRYEDLIRYLQDLFKLLEPHGVAVEDVFLKRSGFSNPKTSKIMGETRGIILSVPIQLQIPVLDVNPSALTKFLGINTRTQDKKEVTKQYASALVGKPVEEDTADAMVIALIAEQMIIEENIKYEKEKK